MIPFGVTLEYVEAPPQLLGGDMTVCIGAICNQKRIPGAIMIVHDVRVSYMANGAMLGKHDLTSKLYQLPFGFAAAIAGTIPDCGKFISYLGEFMSQLPSGGDLQLDHIVFAARNASEQLVLSMFDSALVNNLGMTRNEWINRQSDQVLKAEGRMLLQRVKPDASCLIAGFCQNRPLMLKVVSKNPPEEIPSHSAIGVGAIFALQKLSRRTQGPYCSIQRTALAFSEGVRFARQKGSGYVGPPAHCVILEPGLARQFDSKSDILRKWSKTIKPKDTHLLDADEYWQEFSKTLIEVPRTNRQAGSQTPETGK